MSRKGWKLARAVVVSCVAVAFAFAAAAGGPELSRGALWKVVQACVANRALTGAAFPCLKVDVSQETSAATSSCARRGERPTSSWRLREKSSASKTRRFRRRRRQTISRMLGTPAPFSQTSAKSRSRADDVALAVNPRLSRSQDQLHIHIGCLSRRMRRRLQTLAPELPEDGWARIRGPMNVANAPDGPGLWARRIDSETLAGVNPFRLAAEGRSDEVESRSRLMVAVAGVQLADGRGGFVLLAAYDDPSDPNDQFAAEDFIDPVVSFVKRTPCAKTRRPRRSGKHCTLATG